MSNYYNEIDPLKAEVIREAIRAGAIAAGDVDERSIVDIRGSELSGYRQCHFFAGGGFWSLALRQAEWQDDQPAWTGSCPCPSFSAAGKGKGFDDPRHLWPAWFRLIAECRPPVIFGEQVAAAIGHGWLDLIQTDLEAKDYAVGKAVFGACSVGAPHIRQRLYFCADTEPHGSDAEPLGICIGASETEGRLFQPEGSGGAGKYRNAAQCGVGSLDGQSSAGDGQKSEAGRSSISIQRADTAMFRHGEARPEPRSEHSGELLGESEGLRISGNSFQSRLEGYGRSEQEQCTEGREIATGCFAEAGATGGFWADCDWWYGRDGKYRPIEPGVSPLAHGSPARVGRLRMYGDAIVVPQAAEFIRAYKEARNIR